MKHLPFPLRVAAGLAVTTVERVRDLPKQLTELPVTVASQVLQASMRVQQHVTELAIKGDDVLSTLRPVEETPSWATFDEDIEPPTDEPGGNGQRYDGTETTRSRDDDPWALEERALGEEHSEGEFDSPGPITEQQVEVRESVTTTPATTPDTAPAPGGLAGYDQLTLPQVRARLRTLSLEQLQELLDYEREHANRPSFVGMLGRRIGNMRQQSPQEGSEGSTAR
ncbi:lipid droplet-associated protein [Saccharomonospora marina]|nr:lipid droplet-associated protein [Saccharomonospora marina]